MQLTPFEHTLPLTVLAKVSLFASGA